MPSASVRRQGYWGGDGHRWGAVSTVGRVGGRGLPKVEAEGQTGGGPELELEGRGHVAVSCGSPAHDWSRRKAVQT
jgi:hypothetical protein